MRRIKQQDSTGCGIACIAMLSGASYKEVRSLIVDKLGFDESGKFYTRTSHLVELGSELGIEVGRRRRKFKDFNLLPNKAILATNYNKATGNWHWVVYHRTLKEEYILDPRKSIKNNKRTDLNRIAQCTKHWLGVKFT